MNLFEKLNLIPVSKAAKINNCVFLIRKPVKGSFILYSQYFIRYNIDMINSKDFRRWNCKTINKITSETGAMVDIEESGLVTIAGNDAKAIEKALDWIKSLVEEPEVGKIYEGTVVTIKDFGAFVNIMPGIDGMLHVSQISDKRVERVSDVLKVGQKVRVKLTAIDDRGKLSLSMRHLD